MALIVLSIKRLASGLVSVPVYQLTFAMAKHCD